ncbi:MAG: hypothetical protein ACJAXX_000571 [Roseivirga sp.]|jgi:hypothetical protein
MLFSLGKLVLIDSFAVSVNNIAFKMQDTSFTAIQKLHFHASLQATRSAASLTLTHVTKRSTLKDEEVSQIWNLAIRAAEKTKVSEVPDYLYDKAKYWNDPFNWLSETDDLKMLDRLKMLEKSCVQILEKLT